MSSTGVGAARGNAEILPWSGTARWNRRIAAVAGVVALTWIAVAAALAVLDDQPRQARSTAAGLAALGNLAMSLVGMVLLFGAAVASLTRRRHDAFVVSEGAFIAPPGRSFGYYVASQVLIIGLLGSMAATRLARVDDRQYLIDRLDLPVIVFGALLVLLAPLYFVMVARGLPRVELTSSGLRLRTQFGTKDVAWTALPADMPIRRINSQGLWLNMARPAPTVADESAPVRTRRVSVAVAHSWVRPEFLAATVRYYVANPAARTGIGTVAGYRQLLDALWVGDPAVPV